MTLTTGRTGRVAQLGERLVRNEEAGGSNPLSSTNVFNDFRILLGPLDLRLCSHCVITPRRQSLERRTLGLAPRLRIMLEHFFQHVARDPHDGRIAGASFAQLGHRLVAQIVKAEASLTLQRELTALVAATLHLPRPPTYQSAAPE